MTEKGENLREMVEQIARFLVDEPEHVSVSALDADQQTILQLRVAKSDVGKVVGKHGRLANAIRTILAAAGKPRAAGFASKS
jgi:predicted RNA-binding protein YlqC (UPF0109 family)